MNATASTPLRTRRRRPADTQMRRKATLVRGQMETAQRIAASMARKLPPQLSDDVRSAALLGLVEAANRFDPEQEDTFPAYAARRIRGAILDELRRGDVLPRRQRKMARQARHAVQRLEHQLGRAPTDAEVAGSLEVSLDDYRDRYQVGNVQTVSLDDCVVSEAGPSPLEALEQARTLERVHSATAALSPRERQILDMQRDQHMTLAEIGVQLGITESRVCQLRSRALRKMRDRLIQNDPETPTRRRA